MLIRVSAANCLSYYSSYPFNTEDMSYAKIRSLLLNNMQQISLNYISNTHALDADRTQCVIVSWLFLFTGFIIPFTCFFSAVIIYRHRKEMMQNRYYKWMIQKMKIIALTVTALICALLFAVGSDYVCDIIKANVVFIKAKKIALSFHVVVLVTLKIVCDGMNRSISLLWVSFLKCLDWWRNVNFIRKKDRNVFCKNCPMNKTFFKRYRQKD